MQMNYMKMQNLIEKTHGNVNLENKALTER